MMRISAIELKQKLEKDNNFLLLDVREAYEVTFAKIDPHVHIPMDAIATRHKELDINKPIVVMCHEGVRSDQVCQFLGPLGFDVTNLEGGIDAWSQLVDPSVPRY